MNKTDNYLDKHRIRLFSSLRVDSSKAKELLDWDPKITMDEQLLKIAKAEK